MRRISLQTIQKIFILLVCIWLIILFNNVANLPVLQRTITDSLSRQHLKFHQQQDYSSISSSSSRRRRRQEITRQRIYRNDKRTNSYSSYSKSNTNNINVNDNVNVNNTTAERNIMYDSNKYDDESRKNFNMNTNNKQIFLGQTQTTYVDDEEEDEDNNNDDEDYDDDKKTSRNNNNKRDRNQRPKNKKRHINNDNDNDDADYDDFNNDYEESSSLRRSRLPPRRWRRNKKKKKERINIDLLLPKPIIVMGFPKAGTSSIFSFFQKQGLNSQHWYCCQRKFYFYLVNELLR